MTRRATRPATIVTLAYLLVTLPLFWRAPRTTQSALFTIAHIAATALAVWLVRRRHAPVLLADWLPLLLVPLLYTELPLLMPDSGYHDALVRRWEAALFGTQPARTLAGELPSGLLSEVLHLGYLLYYPLVYVPPLALYVTGRIEEYGRTILALMLTYGICFLIFALFPVEGPRYSWGAPGGVQGGFVRTLTLTILEQGSSRGTAFPSSHAAVAVTQAIVALQYQPHVGVAAALVSVALMIGAVYGGFHYAVDILAGAAIGAIVAVAVPRAWPLRHSVRVRDASER